MLISQFGYEFKRFKQGTFFWATTYSGVPIALKSTSYLFIGVKQFFLEGFVKIIKTNNFARGHKNIWPRKNLGGVKDASPPIFYVKKDGSNSKVLLVIILQNVPIKLVKPHVHVLFTPEC